MTPTLTWAQARRVALRAQGIGALRRTAVPSLAASRAALRETVATTHLLQIDSVSVFARAHHLPVFTRRGSWDVRALDQLSVPDGARGVERLLHEALPHEAAFTTEDVHRLLRFRRRAAGERDWTTIRDAAQRSPHVVEDVRALLAEHGPLSAAAVSRLLGDEERGEGWGWRRTSSQWVVEYLFRTGALDCVGRSPQFERLYLPSGDEEAWARAVGAGAGGTAADGGDAGHAEDHAADVLALTRLAARALGVADARALADYFRVLQRDVRPAIDTLLRSGELTEVRVALPEGERPMLLHHEAPEPAPLRAAALVSPFDPIVFFRPRLEQLYDVEYRIGIYTPAARRTSGYYSLPFLHGDRFPLRVDLRADRGRGVLEVRGTYPEPLPRLGRYLRTASEQLALALAGELSRAARWQGLDAVEVRTGEGSGELAGVLAEAVTAPEGTASA